MYPSAAPFGTMGGLIGDLLAGGTTQDATWHAGEGFLYNNWVRQAGQCSTEQHAADIVLRQSGSSSLQNWSCDGVSGGQSSTDWFMALTSSDRPGLASQLVATQAADGSWSDTSSCFWPLSTTGATGLAVGTLIGNARAPSATICNCNGLSFNANQGFTLDGSCSAAAASPIASYEWDFSYNASNGFATSHDQNNQPALGERVTKPSGFPLYQTWPIALRVTSTDGLQSVATCNVAITPPPHCPIPDIGGVANHVYHAPLNTPVQLDASGSFDADGDPLTYAWDLSNSGQFHDATGVRPTWTFTAPGTYSIAVSVTDAPTLNTTPYNAPSCTKIAYGTISVP